MSLLHSPEGEIDRKVLQAVAGAIKSLETIATGDLKEPFSWLLGFVSSSAHPFSS